VTRQKRVSVAGTEETKRSALFPFATCGRSALAAEVNVRPLLLVFVWLTVSILGFVFVLRYETTPGLRAQPPASWPTQTTVLRKFDGNTLILAVHPHCPCTRATLSSLSSIMAHSQNRLHAYVLFLSPKALAHDWDKTDLWWNAKAIPNTTLISDMEGVELAKFNCRTSGQVLLYDTMGSLRFNGGITSARGHHGDNAGADAIVELVQNGTCKGNQTLVFGCALSNPDSNREAKECQNLQIAR
jgi:hypothetical protein